MISERTQLDFEPRKNITTLRQAISQLRSAGHDPERQYFRFSLDVARSPISPVDIKDLLTFNYEFALYERDGRVIVNTGSSKNASHDRSESDPYYRGDDSKLLMHTHPDRSGSGDSNKNTPSFFDVIKTRETDDKILILAHPEGLMIYRKPLWNPITNESFTGDPKELISKYCKANSIHVLPFNKPPGFKDFVDDLSLTEQYDLERRFVEDTKMIVDEASWDDVVGVQRIIDVVNLRPYTPPVAA